MDSRQYCEYDVIVVGGGLSGGVIAERYASVLNKKVLLIDSRNHMGGNCYDYVGEDTSILVSKYGLHLFHTNYEDVWKYINIFDKWERYEHKVVGSIDGKMVHIPVNITTINMLCEENFKDTNEMDNWLKLNQLQFCF